MVARIFTKVFMREEVGSLLVEAALVYPVFFFLIFSAIEFGMIMFTTSLVNDSLIEASRYGMTGDNYANLQGPLNQCMGGQNDRSTFITCYIKNRANLICATGDCTTIRETSYDSWALDHRQSGIGSGGNVVKYQVTYMWKTLSPLLIPILGRTYPIHSTVYVQNEAF